MKIVAAVFALAAVTSTPVFALDRCSPQEVKQDKSNKRCDDLGFRKVTAGHPEMSISDWARAMQKHEALVAKAIEIGDTDELMRQTIELKARSSEPSSWPDDDRWTMARIYCTTTAQELANFIDDKLKRSARGEVAAEASFKAYRQAAPACKRGILKAK